MKHTCNYCGEDVDVSEARTPQDVARLLIAHLQLVCTAAPGVGLEIGPLAEAEASADLAMHGAATPPSDVEAHFKNWDLISMGGVLLNTHHERMCKPPCCIHSPSNHHMRAWEQVWSQRVRAVFRQCPHGEHHPDPDDLQARSGSLLHRCDGCCLPPEDSGQLAGTSG